jgi:protein involved in polysaccharide export with SLBB domain
VGGEVEKPNRYPYVEGLTVTKAIVIAGGSKKGNMASVRLRRAKPGPDQKSEDIIVHVARALKDPSADYPVYPGDTIWVPQLVF